MTNDSIIRSVSNSILIDACDDYTGLWEIPWQFREIYKETDLQKRRNMAMQVIERLLTNNLIQAGNFRDGEWEIWSLSNEEVISFIEKEWDKLGREPSIGEIIWFEATAKGEEAVKNIST